MLKKRRFFGYTSLLILAILVLTFYANRTIEKVSGEFCTSDVNKIKKTKTALLLGTSRTLRNGTRNNYFYNRINAALELFHSGKIRYLIVSGDNKTSDYNEPLDMKNELIKGGVPEKNIYLDYAGFRTFDSVIRAKEIFGQNSLLIISQKFHNERAVYIARNNNMDAFAYNAKDVKAQSLKIRLREYFARDKVFLDMVLGVKPKFLGAKIEIPES